MTSRLEDHYCPRRGESPMGSTWPGPDKWERLRGEPYHTCSYCGSMHPGEFLDSAAAGAPLGPTDKSYKVYIDVPNPRAGEPTVYASANFEQTGPGWVRVSEANVETLPLDEWRRQHWMERETWVKVEPAHSMLHGKFYFQHLDEPGMHRFIELYNARSLNIGYPGHFYSLPFFMRLGEPSK